MFACLTADLIGSRRVSDRAAVQRQVEQALGRVNSEFQGRLVVPFSFTVGDEWQGLLDAPDAALEADFRLRRLLHPLGVSSGLGLGAVSTPIRDRTAAMDGPCFHRSREALERAKRLRSQATVFASGLPLLDRPTNAICLLLHALSGKWTPKQHRTVMTYADRGTEAAAAEALGVSQPTVHQSLEAARGRAYLQAREELLEFVRTFPLTPEGAP
ncbi:MAG: hypothetical protein Kow0092_19370 [Deferrisomatales bacterium]